MKPPRRPKPPTASYMLGNTCARLVANGTRRCAEPTGEVSQACPEHRPIDPRHLAAAALWFAAGRRALPLDVPLDVPPCSLEGLAHTAGRTREDIDPTGIVRRWFVIAAAAGPADVAPGLWAGSAA